MLAPPPKNMREEVESVLQKMKSKDEEGKVNPSLTSLRIHTVQLRHTTTSLSRPLYSDPETTELRRSFSYLKNPFKCFCGRRGGLMVSALVPGSSGPGSSPGQGHCVVFLGKTINSHSASLHPCVPANLMGVTL